MPPPWITGVKTRRIAEHVSLFQTASREIELHDWLHPRTYFSWSEVEIFQKAWNITGGLSVLSLVYQEWTIALVSYEFIITFVWYSHRTKRGVLLSPRPFEIQSTWVPFHIRRVSLILEDVFIAFLGGRCGLFIVSKTCSTSWRWSCLPLRGLIFADDHLAVWSHRRMSTPAELHGGESSLTRYAPNGTSSRKWHQVLSLLYSIVALQFLLLIYRKEQKIIDSVLCDFVTYKYYGSKLSSKITFISD